jgi:hypothetical protein
VGADNISIIISCQGRAVVAVDGHRSGLDMTVLDIAEDLRIHLTLYVSCIMFQSVDKPTRCNISYE